MAICYNINYYIQTIIKEVIFFLIDILFCKTINLKSYFESVKYKYGK